jgi:hypothetical protein
MNVLQKNDFLQALNRVAECYGKTFNESVGEMYWKSLKRFDLEMVEEAIYDHLDDDAGKHMPLPADIIQRVAGNAEEKAYIAWQRVVRAIRHLGSYHSVVFDDARIHAVIDDMGGWVNLCHTREKELFMKEHEFEKRYAFYFLYPPEVYPRALIGLHDHENKLYGFESEAPTYIGDLEAAKEVYLYGAIHSTFYDEYTYEPRQFVEPAKFNAFNNKTIH